MGLFARLLEPDIQRHLLVEEDERVIDEVRKHWVVSLPWIGVMFLSIPTFVLMIAARGFFWIPMLVGLYLLGFGFWKAHVAHMDRFVITNMRVFRIHGVFNTHLATMPMTRTPRTIVPWSSRCSGTIFDYGHLVFESAAQAQGLREIRYVARPAERDLTIQRVIQRSGLRKKMVMEDEDEADGV